MLTPGLRTGFGIVAYALGAAAVFDGAALLLALGIGTVTFAFMAQPRPRDRYAGDSVGAVWS